MGGKSISKALFLSFTQFYTVIPPRLVPLPIFPNIHVCFLLVKRLKGHTWSSGFLHHWQIKYTALTANALSDSCTYLKPELLGWGTAPWSSITKFIGLTQKPSDCSKNTNKARHKGRSHLSLSDFTVVTANPTWGHQLLAPEPAPPPLCFSSQWTKRSFCRLKKHHIMVSYHECGRFGVQLSTSISLQWARISCRAP